MSAYAIGHLRKVEMGPGIKTYLERIDRTLEPFEGHFIVHGGAKTLLEGHWPGDLIIIAFPDRLKAQAWYDSAAYREILRFRTDNSEGDVMIVDGVSRSHRAVDVLCRP
jgi:uncharacterized protein (DUF1330 family)